VEARITRAESARGKDAINIALVAPRQDEERMWKAEVSLDSIEAHLLSSIILKNIVLAKVNRLSSPKLTAPPILGSKRNAG
jgi:hypothetical protein